jgi:DNA modification methylase
VTVRIIAGDCRTMLASIEAGSVQTCVTSPPYFGLRDYGVAGQIGLERTPDEFVAELVAVFREVRRALRDDGTLWLNLGDSYSESGRGGNPGQSPHVKQRSNRGSLDVRKSRHAPAGLKAKDLIGIPWMAAFALRADGWYLRSDIIWHKPNPMPESVTDRPTKAHEYLFLLTKSERYYYDAAAIKEPMAGTSVDRLTQSTIDEQHGSDRVPGKTNGAMKAVGMRPQLRRAIQLARDAGLTDEHFAAIRACGISDAGKSLTTTAGAGKNTERHIALAAEAKLALGGYYREFLIPPDRNKRSVWTVATMPFKGAHFATFPPALIEPCVLAGSRPGDVVLDPFGGAGTTGLVADRLGREAVLIELNPEYAAMARARVHNDAPLFAEASA